MPDRSVEAAVARYGRPALAWEVLRRDPAYRAAWDRVRNTVRPGVAADADFVSQWGLHFR